MAMDPNKSRLPPIREQAMQTILRNAQARPWIEGVRPKDRPAAPGAWRSPTTWEDGPTPPSDLERTLKQFPPGPQTYDLRAIPKGSLDRADISHLRPGDQVITEGANIGMDPRGAPRVTLRPGYDDGRSAARTGPIITPPAPAGVSVDDNIEMAKWKGPFWFRSQVPNRAPWDYKQIGPQYEAFGNYNYGATGRAIPFPTVVLDQEAGRAQYRDHTSQPGWGSPGPHLMPFLGSGSFGDDPVDQYWIGEGARYHDER